MPSHSTAGAGAVGANGPMRRRRSGGGRNLPAAFGVALFLGAVIIGSLFVVKTAFLGVVLLAILLAIWELAQALATAQVRLPLVPVCVGGVAMLAGAYYGGAEVL